MSQQRNRFKKFINNETIEQREDRLAKMANSWHFSVNNESGDNRGQRRFRCCPKDVIKLVFNSNVCQLNSKSKRMQPTIAIKVQGIFDMIGIDCIFGLPHTNRGKNGIVAITQKIGKLAFAAPIKTKEACEFFSLYISIFGPLKIMVSDQGREFCNKLMDDFCKRMNINMNKTWTIYNR